MKTLSVIRTALPALLVLCLVHRSLAQQTMDKSSWMSLVLVNSPRLEAMEHRTAGARHLERTAFDLPNTEVMAESPTGEFYTIGVQQSFEFPTVYLRQRQVLRERSVLASGEEQLARRDLEFEAEAAYLEAQLNQQLLALALTRDSMYAELLSATERSFAAGTTDRISLEYTRMQREEARRALLAATAAMDGSAVTLQWLCGATQPVFPEAWSETAPGPDEWLAPDTSAIRIHPAVQLAEQGRRTSEQELRLQRSRSLPGLTFGYINQGPRGTPIDLRFRAGITLPLAVWYYSAANKAAQEEYAASLATQRETERRYRSALGQAWARYLQLSEAWTNYSSTGARSLDQLAADARRMYDAGQLPLTELVRMLNDAYSLQRDGYQLRFDYLISRFEILYYTSQP